jgi:hypothetical protein
MCSLECCEKKNKQKIVNERKRTRYEKETREIYDKAIKKTKQTKWISKEREAGKVKDGTRIIENIKKKE